MCSLSSYFTYDSAFGSLQFRENLNVNSTGAKVWDCSATLAAYLEENKKKFGIRPGKRAIELGAGCGLIGIVLSYHGLGVFLSDVEEVVPLLDTNSKLHLDAAGKTEVRELNWDLEVPEELKFSFDFVIASECVYKLETVRPLVKTVVALAHPRSICFVAVEKRDEQTYETFFEYVSEYFNYKKVPPSKYNVHYKNEFVEIYVLKRKKAASS